MITISFFKKILNNFFHDVQIWINWEIKNIKTNILRWNIQINNIQYTKKTKKQTNNRFLNFKNNLSELKKDFTELKDKELRDREIKIGKSMEKLFFKLMYP